MLRDEQVLLDLATRIQQAAFADGIDMAKVRFTTCDRNAGECGEGPLPESWVLDSITLFTISGAHFHVESPEEVTSWKFFGRPFPNTSKLFLQEDIGFEIEELEFHGEKEVDFTASTAKAV